MFYCVFPTNTPSAEAGKLMLKRIDDLLSQGETFAIETTLATKSYVNLIRRAKELGYSVSLLYLWLESPETAIRRVALRVSEGGHSIPEDVAEVSDVIRNVELYQIIKGYVE